VRFLRRGGWFGRELRSHRTPRKALEGYAHVAQLHAYLQELLLTVLQLPRIVVLGCIRHDAGITMRHFFTGTGHIAIVLVLFTWDLRASFTWARLYSPAAKRQIDVKVQPLPLAGAVIPDGPSGSECAAVCREEAEGADIAADTAAAAASGVVEAAGVVVAASGGSGSTASSNRGGGSSGQGLAGGGGAPSAAMSARESQWLSLLVHTAKEAQAWTAVFNGHPIRDEDKAVAPGPAPPSASANGGNGNGSNSEGGDDDGDAFGGDDGRLRGGVSFNSSSNNNKGLGLSHRSVEDRPSEKVNEVFLPRHQTRMWY